MPSSSDNGGHGQAVDRFGRQADDPTKNVRELVQVEKEHGKEILELTARHNEEMRKAQIKFDEHIRAANVQRLESLAQAETRRIDDLASLRLQYDTQISQSRDTQVKTTSDLISKALDKVTDSLSQQINTAVKQFADQLSTAIAALTPRIADMERFRWETGGAARVADPALEKSLSNIGADIKGMQTSFAKTLNDIVITQAEALQKVTKSISAITEESVEGRGVGKGRMQVIGAMSDGAKFLAAIVAGAIAVGGYLLGHNTGSVAPPQVYVQPPQQMPSPQR